MGFDFFMFYKFGQDNVWLTITVRLLLSALFGTLVGLERRYRGQPAGMRTFSMVCISSTILTIFSSYEAEFRVLADTIRLDPTRMAQGIMTGIGFLGAGLLVKESFTIRGITTAAMIWMTAAVGILFGAGLIGIALMGSVLIFAILYSAIFIEANLKFKNYLNLVIIAHWRTDIDMKAICTDLIVSGGLDINKINETFNIQDKRHRMSIYTSGYEQEKFEDLKIKLTRLEYITSVDFQYKN